MNYDVVCVGSSTIDVFIKISRKFSKCRPGDKILINSINFETGGGASNAAVSLSRLKCKVAYLGKFGNDEDSKRLISEYKTEKIDLIPTSLSRLRTPYSVILESDLENDKLSYTYKGAANDLRDDDFDMGQIKTKWLYIATNLGTSRKTVEKLAVYLSKKGVKILFNPSSYMARNKSDVNRILKLTDILVLNKNEARIITNSKKQFKSLSVDLFKMGPKVIIITDGKRGVYYNDGIKELFMNAKKTKVVSVAGAGDAFTSAYLAGIIKNLDVETSLKWGLENASSVLTNIGTKNDLLTIEEIKKLSKTKKYLKSTKFEKKR